MIKDVIKLLGQNRRLYLASNIFYYGLVALFIFLTPLFPKVQEVLLSSVTQSFTSGPMAFVTDAYKTSFLKAVVVTFAVNTVLGSFLVITLPSLVFPPWGTLMAGLRAVMWGIMFSPSSMFSTMQFVGVLLLLILEGQGYVLALFGTFKLIHALITPGDFGCKKRFDAYKKALVMNVKLYVLIVSVLVIAAIYEAFMVIFIMG